LETLLLLQSAPDRAWTAADVAAALRIDPAWALSQLDGLCEQRLAAGTADAAARYRYAPHDGATRTAIDGLAKAYVERRVTVITLIFSKPAEPARQEPARQEPARTEPARTEPPRADAVQAFAEAFLLRKDKDTERDRDAPHG
jgi:hypothetical protein